MTNGHAWQRLGKIAILAFSVILVSTGIFFFIATENAKIHDRGILKAFFFAIQTVTTTGYGSFDVNDDVMYLGCVVMILGSLIWSLFTAQFAAIVIIQLTQEHKQ
jgi:ABC-type phosphate transport system permease subunit